MSTSTATVSIRRGGRAREHVAVSMSAELASGAWRKPIYYEDFLVEVWRLHAAGRDEDARRKLAGSWSWAMQGGLSEKEVRVTFRLLERLGFVTDDEQAWGALPAGLVVYRAETCLGDPSRGFCWTLDRGIAEGIVQRLDVPISEGVVSISEGRVMKHHVLAYITGRGESEIVVRRENVDEARAIQEAGCIRLV